MWGDGAAPRSLVDLAIESDGAKALRRAVVSTEISVDHISADDQSLPEKPSLMVIPTASLTSKIKNGGKVVLALLADTKIHQNL